MRLRQIFMHTVVAVATASLLAGCAHMRARHPRVAAPHAPAKVTRQTSPVHGSHLTPLIGAPAKAAPAASVVATPVAAHQIVAHFFAGSLHDNVIRTAHQFGWKHVLWHTQQDYTVVGSMSVRAPNYIHALGNVIAHYPLQAQFYQGNRVLVITPRGLS